MPGPLGGSAAEAYCACTVAVSRCPRVTIRRLHDTITAFLSCHLPVLADRKRQPLLCPQRTPAVARSVPHRQFAIKLIAGRWTLTPCLNSELPVCHCNQRAEARAILHLNCALRDTNRKLLELTVSINYHTSIYTLRKLASNATSNIDTTQRSQQSQLVQRRTAQ